MIVKRGFRRILMSPVALGAPARAAMAPEARRSIGITHDPGSRR